MCLVSTLSFYLFYRFMIDGERWPNFADRMEWQETKLLRKKNDPFAPLGYPAQVQALKPIFEAHNLTLRHVTHASRKAACQHGEALDIPDAQLRQIGHWDISKMVKHYSTGVAKQAARMFAGHGKEPGRQFLSREVKVPPDSLRKQIFPHLEESFEITREQKDVAGQAFCLACDWFRTVLLQDATVLMGAFPNLPFWRVAPFNTQEFQDYRAEVQEAIDIEPLEGIHNIQRVMPEMCALIETVNSSMHNRLSEHDHLFAELKQWVDKCTRSTEGNILGEIDKWCRPLATVVKGLATQDIPSTTRLHFPSESIQLLNQVPSSSAPVPIATSSSQMDGIQPSSIDSTAAPTSSAVHEIDIDNQVPVYRFSNNDNSIVRLYEEWTKGIPDPLTNIPGFPIEFLEKTYGTAWRKPDGISKAFTRRRRIIEKLRKVARTLKIPESAAASKMELWRRTNNKMALTTLAKKLEKKENLWGENEVELAHIVEVL